MLYHLIFSGFSHCQCVNCLYAYNLFSVIQTFNFLRYALHRWVWPGLRKTFFNLCDFFYLRILLHRPKLTRVPFQGRIVKKVKEDWARRDCESNLSFLIIDCPMSIIDFEQMTTNFTLACYTYYTASLMNVTIRKTIKP